MIEYTYRLAKDQDGELLVTVKPLMNDIETSIQQMMDIPIDTLTQEDKEIFNLKILGLKTIHEFLGALVQEQTLKDAARELKGTVNIQTNQMLDDVTVHTLH
jgi:hypothetical protein